MKQQLKTPQRSLSTDSASPTTPRPLPKLIRVRSIRKTTPETNNGSRPLPALIPITATPPTTSYATPKMNRTNKTAKRIMDILSNHPPRHTMQSPLSSEAGPSGLHTANFGQLRYDSDSD